MASVNMMSPGVYGYETDQSDYVSATSSTIIAIVGGARKGRTVPYLVTNQQALTTEYGSPSLSDQGIYGALEALSQANQVYYMRVVKESARATAGEAGTDKLLYTAVTPGTEANDLVIVQDVVDETNFKVQVSRKVETARVVKSTSPFNGGAGVTVEQGSDKILVSGVVDYYAAEGTDFTDPDTFGKINGNVVALEFKPTSDVTVNKDMNIVSVNPINSSYPIVFIQYTNSNSIVVGLKVELTSDEYTVSINWNGKDSNDFVVKFDNFMLKENDEATYYTAITDESESAIPSNYEVLEEFSNLSLETTSDRFVNNIINNQSEYITVSYTDSGELTSKELTLSGGELGAAYGTAGGDDMPFSISTKYYDSTLNSAVVKFTKPDAFGYFNVVVYDATKTNMLEMIKNVTLDSTDDRFVDNIVASVSNNISVVSHAANITADTDISIIDYVIVGGNDGIEGLTEYDIIEGLKQFDNPESYDVNLLAAPGWYQAEVVNAGIEVCEGRGDCLYIAATPFGLSASEANDWVNGAGQFQQDHAAFDSSYAAFYWPWVQVPDTFSKKNIWLSPEGDVLAQIAYNDRVGQPWYAPAGITRGSMTRPIAVEMSATKGERDLIYGNRNCVNPIINYKSNGIVIWGQKTAQRKSTALDRVNVRRLMNYLKRQVTDMSDVYVFDPNDEYAWDRWVSKVEKLMEQVKNQRGLYEYKVTMSPTDNEIDNNQMPGNVWVKPTKSAEYIPINFILVSTGYNFDTGTEEVVS